MQPVPGMSPLSSQQTCRMSTDACVNAGGVDGGQEPGLAY